MAAWRHARLRSWRGWRMHRRLLGTLHLITLSWKQQIQHRQNQQAPCRLSGSVRVLPSSRGLDAACFCLRSSDSAQLSSWAVLHSRVVALRVCGKGRSKSPSAAVACLKCRLNLVAPDGDRAARRWGRNHSTLVSAVTRGETLPLAAEASKATIPATLNPAGPSEGNCGEGNTDGNSVHAGSSKETSCRESCREGNRPQPQEVAALLNLAAANVLFRGSTKWEGTTDEPVLLLQLQRAARRPRPQRIDRIKSVRLVTQMCTESDLQLPVCETHPGPAYPNTGLKYVQVPRCRQIQNGHGRVPGPESFRTWPAASPRLCRQQ